MLLCIPGMYIYINELGPAKTFLLPQFVIDQEATTNSLSVFDFAFFDTRSPGFLLVPAKPGVVAIIRYDYILICSSTPPQRTAG